ncbi:MAG TPA: alpha/beta hydrolase, partial [Chryseobacterium sp.]
MLKLFLNLFIFIISVIFAKFSGQLYQVFQGVNVEKYQGKNFILEGKIFYNNDINNNSWMVLSALFLDGKGTGMKGMIHSDDAQIYYKKGEWSQYELKGKVLKNAKGIAVGISVAGKGSYYLDDFKLFVLEGKNKIEVPLKNGGFEDASLMPWQSYAKDEGSKMSISDAKPLSGKQSLFIDNSAAVVTPGFGNNNEVGKFMDVNGVKLYYEVYGQGEPLLLIHGNNSSMASFDNQLEVLSKKYRVIGLDSRGQGNSTSNDTKLTYELMADDVNVFLDKMDLKKVNVIGWSDGGNIAVILGME